MTMILWLSLSCWCILMLQVPLKATAVVTKVVVTGASGRTGRLVFAKLLQDSRFEPKALVRSEKSAKLLMKEVKGTGLDQIVICDVTNMKEEMATMPNICLKGANAMVICTSAVVRVRAMSVVKVLLQIPWNLIRRRKLFNFRSLRFGWKNGQYPEMVDYEGQLAQIDFAKSLGIRHIILVSSMGGTDPDNFLNAAGKNADGSGNGDILIWKRKAEKYLIESGLDYTIIHPGGLNDNDSGVEEFVLDVDDNLFFNSKKRSISRGDLADLCVAALAVKKEKNVSFDCVTHEVNDGEKPASAEEALSRFLKEGKTANYSL